MPKYYKIENEKEIFFTGKVLYIEGGAVINPTKEQMLEAGWQIYAEPDPSAEQLLAEAKVEKCIQIDHYDASPNVEEFTINGNPMWLGHELRQQIRTSTEAYEALGYDTMTKVFNGVEFTFPIEQWRQMLNALEVYAAEALNTTERHKLAVSKLTSVKKVRDYVYTEGYPEKLNFGE